MASAILEWDPYKAESNAVKHGVTFEEAASVFDDPWLVQAFDEAHSVDEDRFITMGASSRR